MIEKVAIVGMGALGLLYGTFIAEHADCEAAYILGGHRLESHDDRIFTINGKVFAPLVEDEESASPADLLLVTVKYNDLESALDTMRNCIGENTIIMSLLNGIVSEEIIGQRYGSERIVYTVAQGMDAVKIGDDLTYSQMGKLHIGVPRDSDRSSLDAVTEYFDRIGLPYVEEEDIILRLWSKFMLNAGVNQTCMAFETNYGGCLAEGEAHDVFIGAMEEVIQVAAAEGITIPESAIDEYIGILQQLNPESIPSMRQDSLQKRKTEVDMFSGTVLELAEKHGIPTPVNEFLYCRIKEIEASY